jgi:hypothetical protein
LVWTLRTPLCFTRPNVFFSVYFFSILLRCFHPFRPVSWRLEIEHYVCLESSLDETLLWWTANLAARDFIPCRNERNVLAPSHLASSVIIARALFPGY